MSPPLDSPPRPRSPWQLLYGTAHRLRWRWYAGRAKRLPRPVISVGNLHWGGGGKTPLVAAIAAHLRDRGYATCILSRGYRGKGDGVRLVSSGAGPVLGPLVAGDEPVLLAGELPGVSVVVGADRYQAGRHALERVDPAPDVFVLDDGFSHLKLFRDIDLLAFPAADPFAGGRLLPAGRLREPLASAARADAAILTGSGRAATRADNDAPHGTALAQALRPHGFTGPGFASPTRRLPARLESGEPLAEGAKIVAVAAIARPERFLEGVREAGFEIAETLTFPDHHAYPPRSLAKIERALRDTGATAVLTTTKDRVKLLGRLDAPLAEVPTRAEPEEALWEWLEPLLEQQIATLER